MILSCLNCAARFLVSADAIGARGRVVRCGRCDHVWFAVPPPDLVRSAAEPPASPEPPFPEPLGASAGGGREALSAPPLRDPDEFRIDGPPTRAQLPVLRQEPRRWPARLAWTAAAIAIGLAAAGAWHYRAEVAAYSPDAESLYTAIGIDALPIGFGLELRIERSENSVRQGTRVLAVTGRIENTTSRPRGVPGLRGALFDGNESELRRWTIPAPVVNLAPDQEVEFKTELVDPPEDAVRLSIVFHEPG